MVMGHLFQVECWENILVWVFIWFIMAKVIGKGNDKGLGKEKWYFWKFVYENNGN